MSEMAKKSLIFIVMVVVSIAVILCFVGWTRINQKNELEKRKVKMINPQKLQEIRIVAVEEKVLPPTHQPEKRKKDPLKNKPTPAPKPDILKGKKASKPNPSKKKVVAQKRAPKKSEKRDLRSKRFFPANFRLNNHMIDVGRKLIDKNSSVPIVQASYDRIGFESYLKKMRDMGGRLFVGDAIQQEILAEAIVDDIEGKYKFVCLDEGKKDSLDGMALFRPREIQGEPMVDNVLDYSESIFKGRDLRCVVLLPLDREAGILGALKEYLNESGYHISQFDVVWGNYFEAGRQFGLKVERGRISKTQKIVSLDMILTM